MKYGPGGQRALLNYVRELSGSSDVSRKFVRGIRDRCLRIGDAPLAGRIRDDLALGLRSAPFEPSAVIVYMIENDVDRIVNVFYGGRDYETMYRNAPADTN